MPLTVDERRLTAQACRYLAALTQQDADKQTWPDAKRSLQQQADKLKELSERFERGLPPVR